MKQQIKKLVELVKLTQGINSARAEKQYGLVDVTYYDQGSFENDVNQVANLTEPSVEVPINEFSLHAGDVVISNALQQAAIISKANQGKVPSINFTQVEFIDSDLDKQYFIYLFNNYSAVKRQKEREVQGNMVTRIPIRALYELAVPLPPITEQRKIGQIYNETRKIQAKLSQYSNLLEELTTSLLEENLKEQLK